MIHNNSNVYLELQRAVNSGTADTINWHGYFVSVTTDSIPNFGTKW